jgi:DNA-directed RNA polymerase specialized sigma54-like protein
MIPYNKKLTEQEIKNILELKGKFSYAQIAKRVGRGESVVRRVILAKYLQPKPKPKRGIFNVDEYFTKNLAV